ncbi:MAG: mechanosensitive ion channel protein MscS [Deltaproteobacteria bacterium]|nr:MAG: mechanosensitive ion channel protein MscS [Deltaproteobacteria bacterium]
MDAVSIQNFMAYYHNLIQADSNNLVERLIILCVYGLLAWVVHFWIIRWLKKAAAKTRMPFDDFLLNFLQTPLAITIFLLGMLNALSIEPPLKVPYDFTAPALIRSFGILIWSAALLKTINKLNEKSAGVLLRREKFDRDLFYLFKNVSRIVVVFTSILWILVVWGIELTPIFASAGIVGIAIALAAKDTLANFFGGISIYMDRAYKVGEYIILDSGERGEVVEIGIRSTKLKTRDDVLITIPNSIMANSKIINQSAPFPAFRIRIDVSVAYGSDLDQVEEVLQKTAVDHPEVLSYPEPRVRVRAFADSAINLQLLCWVEDPRVRGRMTHQLIKEIYRTFNELGIEIPYPQHDIYLKNDGAKYHD